MERLIRIGLLTGALTGLAFFVGCGGDPGERTGDDKQTKTENVEQVDQAQHSDNDGNDPFKPKRCPPGKLDDSSNGDCPPGHQ